MKISAQKFSGGEWVARVTEKLINSKLTKLGQACSAVRCQWLCVPFVVARHICIPLHRLTRSCHSCPRWVNAGDKSTPSIYHPRRHNVTTSMVGLKMVQHAEISPKMVNPWDKAGNAEYAGRFFWLVLCSHSVCWSFYHVQVNWMRISFSLLVFL